MDQSFRKMAKNLLQGTNNLGGQLRSSLASQKYKNLAYMNNNSS